MESKQEREDKIEAIFNPNITEGKPDDWKETVDNNIENTLINHGEEE